MLICKKISKQKQRRDIILRWQRRQKMMSSAFMFWFFIGAIIFGCGIVLLLIFGTIWHR